MSSLQQPSHGGVCGANDMCLLIFDDDDGEIITVDENKDEVDNSIARKKKISLLNKWKRNHRRSTASIIRTDHPSVKASRAAKLLSTSLPTINESRNDAEEEGFMIPDDISESSFNVLKRYMGCSPIPYGTRRSTVATRDRDDNGIRVCAPSNEMVKEDIKSTQSPSLPLTQTRDDIKDDTSEASSLDVLLRYVGCTPISYCDHKQHSTTTITSAQVNDNSRNEISGTNPSHLHGSCEIDDSNSLLPDDDYDKEESIDDITPELRHELLIEVIKEMITSSNDHQAERNVDNSTRREEEACQKIERDTGSDYQNEEDTEMKSFQRMPSPRKILFKRLLAKAKRNQ